ncbi:hypothetical protein KW794_03685, partial [Candidatus Saccharibacteria bacterium]|nr:hypothetical protein [Candidatus Saccharibacteria bacterium]
MERASCLDALQGADEERTEVYMKYAKGVPQSATQQGAKSDSSAAGSAGGQAGAPRRPFAVFDIDGTLIRWQLYHSTADTLARLGHIEPKLHQTIKDARMVWKRRAGEFGDSLS